MNAITREWVDKAEGDFATASRELRARNSPNLDAACFHAQQCAEKYLKARLHDANIPFPKTHDLSVLLQLAIAKEPGWARFDAALRALSPFAVLYRYPGVRANRTHARDALRACRAFRATARLSLGLKAQRRK